MANVNQAAQDQDMFEQALEEPVTDHELQEIAPRIANNWRGVARNLGLGVHEISNIAANCYGAGMGGIEETALQMLIRWQRRNGQQATKRILINALRNAGFQAVAQTLERNIN
ncbi:putative serine/threonine-protein kinase pats1-like [Apostichopus japonicus]|uniref:Putative serine/threonine-protein kinase pats1-like n=1 Tax=Stichopus japonicus TaxID=307972 RepID=A0A2G8JZY9_STIJA|nr:putative serine/threonine-protein kinase pats1-like [Apostichopus japonicus]